MENNNSNESKNSIDSESISFERVIDSTATNDEKTAESALRPKHLEEFGQVKYFFF